MPYGHKSEEGSSGWGGRDLSSQLCGKYRIANPIPIDQSRWTDSTWSTSFQELLLSHHHHHHLERVLDRPDDGLIQCGCRSSAIRSDLQHLWLIRVIESMHYDVDMNLSAKYTESSQQQQPRGRRQHAPRLSG